MLIIGELQVWMAGGNDMSTCIGQIHYPWANSRQQKNVTNADSCHISLAFLLCFHMNFRGRGQSMVRGLLASRLCDKRSCGLKHHFLQCSCTVLGDHDGTVSDGYVLCVFAPLRESSLLLCQFSLPAWSQLCSEAYGMMQLVNKLFAFIYVFCFIFNITSSLFMIYIN